MFVYSESPRTTIHRATPKQHEKPASETKSVGISAGMRVKSKTETSARTTGGRAEYATLIYAVSKEIVRKVEAEEVQTMGSATSSRL